MRKFSSYGAISTRSHYYAPRAELIEETCQRLIGERPDEGGHYVEAIDAENRQTYQAAYHDVETSVDVHPLFVATGV